MNYVLLGTVLLLFSLITSTRTLVLGALLVAYWTWFLPKNEDPEWTVVVLNMPLQKQHRTYASAAISGILVLVVSGGLICSVVGFHALMCVLHAIANRHVPEDN